MATKYSHTAEAYEAAPLTTDIVLTIEGLIANHDGSFVLRDVKPINIDYATVTLTLTQAGIDHIDAEMLTERFATMVFQDQLAKTIAQRTKRVG